MSRAPLSDSDIARLLSHYPGAHVQYAPGRPSQPQFARLFAGQTSFAEYTQSFDGLATPVDDDHPFYFATDKPWGIPDFLVRLLRTPIIAVVLFVVGTSWLSGKSITADEDQFWKVQFRTAGNLKTSSPVRISGVPVGKVERIRLEDVKRALGAR